MDLRIVKPNNSGAPSNCKLLELTLNQDTPSDIVGLEQDIRQAITDLFHNGQLKSGDNILLRDKLIGDTKPWTTTRTAIITSVFTSECAARECDFSPFITERSLYLRTHSHLAKNPQTTWFDTDGAEVAKSSAPNVTPKQTDEKQQVATAQQG